MSTVQKDSNTMSHLVVRGNSAREMYSELYGHLSSIQQSYLRKLATKRKSKAGEQAVRQGE